MNPAFEFLDITGNRDQHESKRIQNSWHLVSSLSPARRSADAPNLRESKHFEFSDHTGATFLRTTAK
jgi:hypothetical protein